MARRLTQVSFSLLDTRPVIAVRRAAANYARGLEARSRAIPLVLARKIEWIMLGWTALVVLFSIPKILFAVTPAHNLTDWLQLALPYLLIAVAPLAGYVVAAAFCRADSSAALPDFRLSFYGRWRQLDPAAARANPLYGPAGFLASLLIGLLLNVVVRSGEFMVAVPAMNAHAPAWGQMLFHVMAADVMVMGFFYMVCFVMALRAAPLFPRMLLFAWALDITAQLIIAQQVGAMPGLPPSVSGVLQSLLMGNMQKVLISAFVWLPYLILSERVNLTYRHRMAECVT